MPIYDTDIKLGSVFEVEEGDNRRTSYLDGVDLTYEPRPNYVGEGRIAIKVTPYDEDGEITPTDEDGNFPDDAVNEQAPQFFLRCDGDTDFNPDPVEDVDGPVYYLDKVSPPLPVATVWQNPSSSTDWATHTYAYNEDDSTYENIYSTSSPLAQNTNDVHPIIMPVAGGAPEATLLRFRRTFSTSIGSQYFGTYRFDFTGNSITTKGQYPPSTGVIAGNSGLAEYWNANNQSLHAACYDPINSRVIAYLYFYSGGNTRHEFWELDITSREDRLFGLGSCKRISAHSTSGSVGFTGIVAIPAEYGNADGTKFIGNDYTGISPAYRAFREITIPTGLSHSASYTNEQVTWTTPTGWNWAASASQEAINNGRCLARMGKDLYVTNPPADGSTASNNILRKVHMFNADGDLAPSLVAMDDSELEATPSSYTSSIDLFALFPSRAEQTEALELVSHDEPIDEEILGDTRYIPSGDDDEGDGIPKQVRFQFITEDEDNEYAVPTSITVGTKTTDITLNNEGASVQKLLGQFNTVRGSDVPDDAKTNLTVSALREIHSPHVSPWAALLFIWVGNEDDPDWSRYFTNYNEPITSDGNVYVPHNFTMTFPPRSHSTEIEVSVSLTNIDGDLAYLLTANASYINMKSSLVRVHEPSVILYGPVTHVYRDLEQNSNRIIELTGKVIDVIDEPAVEERYTPAFFPGLF